VGGRANNTIIPHRRAPLGETASHTVVLVTITSPAAASAPFAPVLTLSRCLISLLSCVYAALVQTILNMTSPFRASTHPFQMSELLLFVPPRPPSLLFLFSTLSFAKFGALPVARAYRQGRMEVPITAAVGNRNMCRPLSWSHF